MEEIAFDRRATYASFRASVDVKRILRKKIYEKLLKLGASYRERVATSEVVQMAAEGVEQLETYFGRYLSQLFYSLLAPLTLFVILAFVNRKASIVLLICVPLIPLSIVAVQKFAKKLLNQYWGIYTGLGDSFLENLQGLTTLKIYRADADKAEISIRLSGEQFSYEGKFPGGDKPSHEGKLSHTENRDILKEVSMELPAGSFTSLVGTSGCGKSTIAGILMGRNKGYNTEVGELGDLICTRSSRQGHIIMRDGFSF